MPRRQEPKEEEEEEEDDEEEDEEESGDEGAAPASAAAPVAAAPEPEPAAPPAPPRAPGLTSDEYRPHTDFPPMRAPQVVRYCPTCGLPPDFCRYGPSWERCKPWCLENYPEYFPDLAGASLDDAKKSAQAVVEKQKVKELPGGKMKRAKSPEVTIKKLTRGGRKCVTTVGGLDGFGVKLDAVAKLFKKKFACGAAVVKGEAGAEDAVEIQGDFGPEVVDVICDEYKTVPRQKFSIVDGGTKKKGKR